ncbi:MAG: hypothetical protein ABIP41_00775 [Croceibacterium sp.]
MNFPTILLAPLALMVPALAHLSAERDRAPGTAQAAPGLREDAARPAPPPFELLEDGHRAPVQRQVSIEQRVIIRIAPSMADPRQRMPLRAPPGDPPEDNFKEEKVHGCVPIATIAAITPSDDNRLLLLLRDRQVLSATLEKSCNVDEFYSGAYVERNADGKLCPKREQLQSRMGSKCRISRIGRLVPRD